MDREEAIGDLNLSTVELASNPPSTDAEVETSLAELLYNGYRIHTGGISLATNQPIPEWRGLRPNIQEAWRASARVAMLYSVVRSGRAAVRLL